MSIVTTPVLRELYNAAKAPNAQEPETMAFWNHYFNKHSFTGDEWVVHSEYPPSSHHDDRKRRCDGVIKHYSRVLMKLVLVANVEGKRHGGSMTEVEAQLTEACESSSKDPTSLYPFGIAIIGIRMKVFQRVGGGAWRDIMSAYVDADSSHGYLITSALNSIKQSVQTQPQAVQHQTPQAYGGQHSTPATAYQYSSAPTYGHSVYGAQSLSTPSYAPTSSTARPRPAGVGWVPHTSGRWYRMVGGKPEWD
ncbi:hypothetical protein EJ07DRAFT_160538 [Lizonia empirigonia]|nr:hypothetical protein EJ07DRAFT_160538 [Lizonia empirigonia]